MYKILKKTYTCKNEATVKYRIIDKVKRFNPNTVLHTTYMLLLKILMATKLVLKSKVFVSIYKHFKTYF